MTDPAQPLTPAQVLTRIGDELNRLPAPPACPDPTTLSDADLAAKLASAEETWNHAAEACRRLKRAREIASQRFGVADDALAALKIEAGARTLARELRKPANAARLATLLTAACEPDWSGARGVAAGWLMGRGALEGKGALVSGPPTRLEPCMRVTPVGRRALAILASGSPA